MIIAMVITLSACSQKVLTPKLVPIKHETKYRDLNVTYEVVKDNVVIKKDYFISLAELLSFYKSECKKKDLVLDRINDQINDYNKLNKDWYDKF